MTKRASPVGKRFGNFHIVAEAGRGGMGVVYRARDVVLSRDVALKVLPSRLARDTVHVERFLREARTAALLKHPSICQILSVGEHRGIYYIAMEFIEGATVSDIMRDRGPFELDRALEVMRQVCDALGAAHSHGIIHRDIKPQNIMIDTDGRVRVLDFGLAKAAYGSTDLTGDGIILGTPLYMSPEQCQGEPIDARTDIYSLGVTLFELLAGHPPFDPSTPVALMYQIVQAPFPPIQEHNPSAPPEAVDLLDKMTAKSPEHRYQTARELAHALDRAKTASRGRLRMEPAALRKRLALAAMAALVILLGIGVGAGVVLRYPDTGPQKTGGAFDTSQVGTDFGGTQSEITGQELVTNRVGAGFTDGQPETSKQNLGAIRADSPPADLSPEQAIEGFWLGHVRTLGLSPASVSREQDDASVESAYLEFQNGRYKALALGNSSEGRYEINTETEPMQILFVDSTRPFFGRYAAASRDEFEARMLRGIWRIQGNTLTAAFLVPMPSTLGRYPQSFDDDGTFVFTGALANPSPDTMESANLNSPGPAGPASEKPDERAVREALIGTWVLQDGTNAILSELTIKSEKMVAVGFGAKISAEYYLDIETQPMTLLFGHSDEWNVMEFGFVGFKGEMLNIHRLRMTFNRTTQDPKTPEEAFEMLREGREWSLQEMPFKKPLIMVRRTNTE